MAAKRTKRNNGLRYTDEQKMIAVETVRVSGGVVTDKTLADVRLVLNAPTLSLSTLDAWVKNAHYEPSTNGSDSDSRKREKSALVFDPNAAAIEQWRQTRIAYLKRANEPSAILWTEGKDAVAAAERAQKMEQLLEGLPTEVISVTVDLDALAKRKGLSTADVLKTLRDQMSTLPDVPMVTAGSGAN